MLGWLAIGFLAPAAHPQSSATAPPQTPPADRSFDVNQPMDHPEALSGVWESSDGRGGAVGIHLELMTMVPGDADSPVWVPQSWQHFNLGVFEREGPELVFGEENYFTNDPSGGRVTFEKGSLRLHFATSRARIPSVDLDLFREPDGCWRGRFHRGSFDSVVTLCRPTPGPSVALSPLVGTWSGDHGRPCVHIFESPAGTFTGWSDTLEIPGQIVFGHNSPGPHQLYQNYGDRAKVNLTGNGEISVEFNAYSAGCCSQRFAGKISADGFTIQGDFTRSPNQNPHRWTKMPGDSCVDPTTLHSFQPTGSPSSKK